MHCLIIVEKDNSNTRPSSPDWGNTFYDLFLSCREDWINYGLSQSKEPLLRFKKSKDYVY